MKRDLDALSTNTYDLVIIGGGIFGACAAWDAALRGLSVALVERGDFSQAASANCFKIVHGGIRYLQHGDIVRVRESSRERRALLRIAPDHVRPLPIVVPTYGHGLRGQALMRAAMSLYDALTADRNDGIRDPAWRIPSGRCLSRAETLALFPGLETPELTGAAVFHDAQIASPARLVMAFLHSAAREGADAANYVEATGFLRGGDRITGVRARDALSGQPLEIRGRIVLNAAGAWAERLLARDLGLALPRQLTFSRDAFFIMRKRLNTDHALAVQAKTKDPDALLSRGRRHLFLAPWGGYTLVGVWHKVHRGDPDTMTLTESELPGFLEEINAGYPLGLTPEDVVGWGAGLILFGENAPGATHLSYGKRSILVDHHAAHGLEGLVSLIGVRYTTARGMAERALDLICAKLGASRPCRTETTPLHHNGDFSTGPAQFEPAKCLALVREEQAQTLSDVVFRRTDLGTAGHPGEAALRACAEVMATELGWDAGRVQRELDEVERAYPRRGAATRPQSAGAARAGATQPVAA